MTEETGAGIEGEAGTDIIGTPAGLTLKPNFGGRVRDGSSKAKTSQQPSFSGTYIDPEDPESSGAPPAFSSMYMPSFYKGMIEAATFLFDLPIQGVGWAMGEGAEALGWDELAKDFRRPVTVGGVVKEVFEAPARIEEAVREAVGAEDTTAGVLTGGFRATPAPLEIRKKDSGTTFFILVAVQLLSPSVSGLLLILLGAL